ncbi:Plexin A3 [Lamellibrachia satsuma]|nr:Plexin A3 [Lamellibrachia satsuma]
MVLWPSSDSRFANPVYDVVDVQSGAAIKSDMLLDSSDTHAYVLTSSKVHHVVLSKCSRFRTCDTCHATSDPHCGWCMLQNRCTLSTECASSDIVHNWMSSLGSGCPAISSLTPHMVDQSRFRSTKFVVNLHNVPLIADQLGLECELRSSQLKLTTTTEGVAPDTVTCRPFISTPSVPSNTGFVELEFSIVMNDTRVASKSVFVYQCSFMASCVRCTGTKFGCVWCPLEGRCINNVSECSSNQDISNSASCPWVSALGGVGGQRAEELLIPAGMSSAIDVIVVNLQEQYAKNLKCRFALGGGLVVTANVSQPVTPESTHVTCQTVKFSFEDDQPFLRVAVDVLWGDNKPIDSPNQTHGKYAGTQRQDVLWGDNKPLDSPNQTHGKYAGTQRQDVLWGDNKPLDSPNQTHGKYAGTRRQDVLWGDNKPLDSPNETHGKYAGTRRQDVLWGDNKPLDSPNQTHG